MTSRVWHPALATLAGFIVALAPARVHAQNSVELSWDAPPGCPQEAQVREKLRALRGQTLQAAGRLRAEGRIERMEQRYRMTLTVREGDAVRQRTMEADSCNDLAGAAAVALGLLIRNGPGAQSGDGTDDGAGDGSGRGTDGAAGGDGNGANDARGSSDTGGARSSSNGDGAAPKPNADSTAKRKEPAHDKSRSPDESASSPAIAESERHWRIFLRAPVGVLGLVRLPKPSGGVGGGVGFAYDEWRVAVGGRIFRSQTTWSNDAFETRARVNLWALDLGVCREFRSGPVSLVPCLGAGFERITARGAGPGVIPQSGRKVAWVIDAGVEAHFYAADWLALVPAAGLGVETSRPQLTVISAGDVKKLGPVQLTFSVGSEWIF